MVSRFLIRGQNPAVMAGHQLAGLSQRYLHDTWPVPPLVAWELVT